MTAQPFLREAMGQEVTVDTHYLDLIIKTAIDWKVSPGDRIVNGDGFDEWLENHGDPCRVEGDFNWSRITIEQRVLFHACLGMNSVLQTLKIQGNSIDIDKLVELGKHLKTSLNVVSSRENGDHHQVASFQPIANPVIIPHGGGAPIGHGVPIAPLLPINHPATHPAAGPDEAANRLLHAKSLEKTLIQHEQWVNEGGTLAGILERQVTFKPYKETTETLIRNLMSSPGKYHDDSGVMHAFSNLLEKKAQIDQHATALVPTHYSRAVKAYAEADGSDPQEKSGAYTAVPKSFIKEVKDWLKDTLGHDPKKLQERAGPPPEGDPLSSDEQKVVELLHSLNAFQDKTNEWAHEPDPTKKSKKYQEMAEAHELMLHEFAAVKKLKPHSALNPTKPLPSLKSTVAHIGHELVGLNEVLAGHDSNFHRVIGDCVREDTWWSIPVENKGIFHKKDKDGLTLNVGPFFPVKDLLAVQVIRLKPDGSREEGVMIRWNKETGERIYSPIPPATSLPPEGGLLFGVKDNYKEAVKTDDSHYNLDLPAGNNYIIKWKKVPNVLNPSENTEGAYGFHLVEKQEEDLLLDL